MRILRRGVLIACVWGLGASAVFAELEHALPSAIRHQLLQPITANLQDVDFASAVAFLAETANLNIILSEKSRAVAKPVTVHLVEMPLYRALEYLLNGQGLLFRYDGQAIWVATHQEMEAEPMDTRVFFLKEGPGLYAAFQPLPDTRTSVALHDVRLKAVTTLKDVLSEVIPKVGNSSIVLDERTGALVVTHVPYYLQQIDGLLEQLDVRPLEVMIEARFIELTVTDTTEWGLDSQLTGNLALTKGQDKDGTSSPEVQLSSTGTSLLKGTKIDFSDFTNQLSGLNLTFQGILSGTQYASVLHALMKNDRSKTLSAPRITTLNNQTATIKIVTEFVYPTRYEASVVRKDLNSDGDFQDIVSGVQETKFVNVPQDFVTKDLGIVLNVTPSVGQDLKAITLALKPEVSEKKTDDTFGGDVSLPRFTARNLQTSVVIDDGQTVMLGGLMKDTTNKTITKVPVLGSIPVLGLLFKKHHESVERSNLLIFVTASLVNPAGARLASTSNHP